MKKTVHLLPHNHFDPTWRRCFDRSAVFNGVTVRSYAEVEAHCIDAWLKLAKRGYTFHEGQVAVWRKYLERHPRRKAELRKLAASGRLDVLLAGETIQDSTMPAAEGLVRNFLVAAPFYRQFVGDSHPALKLATLEDAFGNSPNYPQVLKGVGAEAVCWASYRPIKGSVWVGIDGTKLAVWDSHSSGFAGAFAKHPPCPSCSGQGCKACDDTGLMFIDGFDLSELRKGVDGALAAHPDSPWVAIRFLTEEVRPDSRVADFVDEFNAEPNGIEMRFATPTEIYDLRKHELADAVSRRDDKPTEDLNPAMPGCLVSRIRCKQRVRAISYHLLAAEAALANRSWAGGKPQKQPQDLTQAWSLVAFNQFHDAITGTHIDSANDELMEMLDQAESIAQQTLPLKAKRPAVGKMSPIKGNTTRRIGTLDVTFDLHGIVSIQRGGIDLFGEFPPPWNNRRRRPRIAELVLEPDFGDAWGKRICSPTPGQIDYTMVLLGDYHTTVEASDRAIRWKGRYTGGDWKVKRLDWTVTAAASDDGRRIDFTTAINWDTGSRRIRVVVPVKSQDPTATYEVPFGFIDRTFDAGKLDYSIWNSNSQEFATLHWVRKQIDATSGVALLNKGLPCNRWAPGMFDLSLVRSPEFAFCAVEPGSYEFWDTDGQRDPGRHLFEYSLFPYYDGLSSGDLTRAGYEYNLPAPLAPPFTVEGDVVVTAWKPAEDGTGWMLRVQEAGGEGTTVRIQLDRECEVVCTNLLEQPQGDPSTGSVFEYPLHRHGIATLRIRHVKPKRG